MPSLPKRQPPPAEADTQQFRKPGETLDQLYSRSAREVQKWRKLRRCTLGVSWSGLLLMMLGALVMPYIGLVHALPMFGFLLVIGAMLGLLTGILLRPSRRNALNSLLQTDDIRAAGPLLEATQLMMPDVAVKAAQSLVRLLPRLRAEHTQLLTSLQRRYLRSLIVDDAAKRTVDPGLAGIAGAVNSLNVLPSIPLGKFFSFYGANKFFGCRTHSPKAVIVGSLV